jgi:hypothetical protein
MGCLRIVLERVVGLASMAGSSRKISRTRGLDLATLANPM